MTREPYIFFTAATTYVPIETTVKKPRFKNFLDFRQMKRGPFPILLQNEARHREVTSWKVGVHKFLSDQWHNHIVLGARLFMTWLRGAGPRFCSNIGNGPRFIWWKSKKFLKRGFLLFFDKHVDGGSSEENIRFSCHFDTKLASFGGLWTERGCCKIPKREMRLHTWLVII